MPVPPGRWDHRCQPVEKLKRCQLDDTAGPGRVDLSVRPGPTIAPKQQAKIVRAIQGKCPDQLKLPFALWSREAVVELIKTHTGRQVSVWTAGRYLKDWGFTPQKLVRRAYKRDPVAVQAWLDKEYPAIHRRAKAQNALILWGDEMGLRSDDTVGRTYSLRGQTPIVPATGGRFGCSMISAISNLGRLWFMVFSCRFNADVFIRFLTRLSSTPPEPAGGRPQPSSKKNTVNTRPPPDRKRQLLDAPRSNSTARANNSARSASVPGS